MREKKNQDTGIETVEVPVVLQKDVYESIEKISIKLGMQTSSWINLVLLSKLKTLTLEAEEESGDI